MHKRDRLYPLFSILFLSFVISACAQSIKKLPVDDGYSSNPCKGKQCYSTLQVQYLGTSGVLLRRGNDGVLTAPFFSTHSLLESGFSDLQVDDKTIKALMPTPVNLKGVQTILVGHAHFDHLLDVPFILKNYLPRAKVYGSKTMKNIILKSVPRPKNIIALNSKMATSFKVGKWVYRNNGRVRIMALESEHSPHFWGIKLYKGKVEKPLAELPKDASGFKEGQTLAYVIDFLNPDKSIQFRIHFQDAPSNHPYGAIPYSILSRKKVDLAILCVGAFDQVKRYPQEILLQMAPKNVLMTHWEDMFVEATFDRKRLRAMRTVDVNGFVSRTMQSLPKESSWMLPKPGAWMMYEK